MIDLQTGRAGALARLGALLLATGMPLAAAQEAADLEVRELAPDVYLITGAGANVVAVTTGGGAVLVDGGTAERSAELLETVAALPRGGPVHTLFNTHWHPEQTGSNLPLGGAGARIIAHENTRLWMTTDITRPYEPDTTYGPYPEEAHPDETFYGTGRLLVEGVEIEYGYLRQAHTDGDIYVYFPQANVLVAGDVVTGAGAGWPFVDWWTGGWIGGIAPAIAQLLEVGDAETVIVPARGALLGKADLEQQRAMYATIFERLRTLLYNGRSPEEAVQAEPTKEFDARMGPPEDFIRRAFESLWGHLSPDA